MKLRFFLLLLIKIVYLGDYFQLWINTLVSIYGSRTHNKLQCQCCVGLQAISVLNSPKQETVSRTDSLLVLVFFFVGFVDSNKNIEFGINVSVT